RRRRRRRWLPLPRRQRDRGDAALEAAPLRLDERLDGPPLRDPGARQDLGLPGLPRRGAPPPALRERRLRLPAGDAHPRPRAGPPGRRGADPLRLPPRGAVEAALLAGEL